MTAPHELPLDRRPLFSSRLPRDLTPSATAVQLQRATVTCDLMLSNPTACSFVYPDVHTALAGPSALPYRPDALGTLAARQHVAAYVSQRYGVVGPHQIMLTASTSEAYSLVFKLLTDPADSIVVDTPTYPLVQHLAELEHIQVAAIASHWAGRWQADMQHATALLEAGARAVVLVSPNNPTGACLRVEEARAWAALAARFDVPLIIDQVFAPYATAPWAEVIEALSEAPLAFFLDGLSKAAGLPHVKLGWVTVRGHPSRVSAAMERLAWLGDAYLSVSQGVQHALPQLFAVAEALQPQIWARICANRLWLADHLAQLPEVTLLPAEGGWYGVLRLPQSVSEDDVVTELAQRAQVRLHPGYFYDFTQRGYLVTSLLSPPAIFAAGWRRAAQTLREIYA